MLILCPINRISCKVNPLGIIFFISSMPLVKMAKGTFAETQITNIEMKSHALLEIAPGMHSPVCPYLV